jgi:hypothetical protein
MPNFYRLVLEAQSGSKEAMQCIIDQFMPKIRKHSLDENQHLDEDCQQFIIWYLISAVKHFEIRNVPEQENSNNFS